MANIPIQNIYYLLCYAWESLTEKDLVDTTAIASTELVDLFARVLVNGTKRLAKRGFDRAFLPEHEWTPRLRGRIAFQEALKGPGLKTGRLLCNFDELSRDVLHNRLLKSTMLALRRVDGLAVELADALGQLCRMLEDVTEIELTARAFRQVQLHRNNSFYEFLMNVCELIHRNLLVSEETGVTTFRDFLRDEHQMRRLFEEFVRSFYRQRAHGYAVASEELQWQWEGTDELSLALLPRMVTDVSLTSEERKIVIDCKYSADALQHHYSTDKLKSEHLYQINAYMHNLTGVNAAKCEMMLLYPTAGANVSARFTHQGRRISIRTINLNQDWQTIEADMLSLLTE